MEITTIDKETVDTNKLNDNYAEMVETIENSGIRKLVAERGGYCFILGGTKDNKEWGTMHLPNDGMKKLITAVSKLLMRLTDNKFMLAVVPVEDLPNSLENKN